MQRKILISILGKGRYDKEKNINDYELTRYQLPGETPVQGKLVSGILAQELKPEKIYIVGTEESLWKVADKYISNYEKVIIPYGTDTDEFWKIFDSFTLLDVENGEIHFDITHGFRSIPIFVSTILNFFKNVKNANIAGVYYGIFEAKTKESGITPVINMLPFLEMRDWIDAFNIFRKYSDGRDIAGMIQEKFRLIPNEQKKRFGTIQRIAKDLDFYSRSIGFSAVEFYIKSLEKMNNNINKIDEIPPELHAIKYLLESMREEAHEFEELKTTWEKSLKAAVILYNKNRYAQSLTLLRELILTYILEELSLDHKDEKLREDAISGILREDFESFKHEDKHTYYFSSEFIDLYFRIRELRNKSNHAFIKKSVGEKGIRKSVENLQQFLKETEELLNSGKVFKDADKMKVREALQPTQSKRTVMLLLFSHKLTSDQVEDAKQHLGIKKFIYLPDDLQKIFSNIPPDAESISEYLKPIKAFIRKNTSPHDYILIQGEFGVSFALVRFAEQVGRIPVYATTERFIREEKVPEGIKRVSRFKHIRFRRYEV